MNDDRIDLGHGITVSRENAEAIDRGYALAESRLPALRETWSAMTVPQLKALVSTMRSTRGMQVKQHYLDALEAKTIEACLAECGYRREY